MMRIILPSVLLLVAIAANAALYLRPEETAPAITGSARITLGSTTLAVPRAVLANSAQWGGGRMERVDITLRADDFAPLPPRLPSEAHLPMPERVQIRLSVAAPNSGAAERFQLLYSRFVSAETLMRPDGLVTRRFRAGTPYEDLEIHLGAGIGQHFYALCPKPDTRSGAPAPIEPCTAILSAPGITAELRFPVSRLGEWKRIGTKSAELLESWREAATQG
jgi:hypothetical protein